jgi:amino acid transporter
MTETPGSAAPATSGTPATTAASNPSGESALRREIGVLLAVAIVINATIGTGIFKTPAKVARVAGSMGAAYGVWVAGAVIALCGALTLAELSAALPRTGGIYEYLRRAWGKDVAFVYGWAKLTLLIPSAVGSFAKLSAEATSSLLGLLPDPARDTRLSLGFLLICTVVNLMGVRTSAMQQAAITAAKYLGVMFLAAVGLIVASSGQDVPVPANAPAFAATPSWSGCFTALVSVMWAYDGWADLASLSGEVKQPGRSLPRALVLGTLAIAVVYLAANFGMGRVLGIEGLRRSTSGTNMAAANLASLTLGAAGRQFLSALILVSCLGGCMSSLLTGPRVFVALATDGLFVRWLGAVSPKSGVPARAVMVSALLGGLYVSARSFEQLTDAFVVGYFPFYILAVGAVFRLRSSEPALERPFKVPGYPLTPILFVAGAVALLIGAAGDVDRTALFAFGILALGVPLGIIWRKFASSSAPATTTS